MAVTVFWRDQAGEPLKAEPPAQNEILQFPEIGIEIAIAAIYEGIVFDEATMGAAGE